MTPPLATSTHAPDPGLHRRQRTSVRARAIVVLVVSITAVAGSCGHVPYGGPAGVAGRRGSDDVGVADGYIGRGDSVSLDDDQLPAISHLDPALLDAVRRAAADAADAGIDLRVTSGWRSAAYQQSLVDDATARSGRRTAAREVLPADRSKHVTGTAIDVGPTDAADWLSRRGSEYGLCQVYANEVWHFELLTRPGGTCPEMHPDASS